MKPKQRDFEDLLRELTQAELKQVLFQGNYKVDPHRIAQQWFRQGFIPHTETCLLD